MRVLQPIKSENSELYTWTVHYSKTGSGLGLRETEAAGFSSLGRTTKIFHFALLLLSKVKLIMAR